MTDDEFLMTHAYRLDIDEYHFSERVSIKVDSNIEEDAARWQALEEITLSNRYAKRLSGG
jgi:hypothetical protein